MTDKFQEANKRWRESSPEAKEKSNYLKMRSTAKSFIRNRAELEDIKELKIMLNERESFMKILALKELIEREKHTFPAIRIWENKAERLAELEMNDDEDVEWVLYVEDVYRDFEDDEKIIEVDIGNGIPEVFHAHEWVLIDEYTN